MWKHKEKASRKAGFLIDTVYKRWYIITVLLTAKRVVEKESPMNIPRPEQKEMRTTFTRITPDRVREYRLHDALYGYASRRLPHLLRPGNRDGIALEKEAFLTSIPIAMKYLLASWCTAWMRTAEEHPLSQRQGITADQMLAAIGGNPYWNVRPSQIVPYVRAFVSDVGEQQSRIGNSLRYTRADLTVRFHLFLRMKAALRTDPLPLIRECSASHRLGLERHLVDAICNDSFAIRYNITDNVVYDACGFDPEHVHNLRKVWDLF